MSNPRDFHAPQSSYTKEDLLKSGEGGYFGPGNAQLPAPPMLMIDRITEISLDGGEFGKGHVVAELDIAPGLWFFDCHFLGDPVMPGCLGLDAMWQIVGYWLGWSGSPGKGRAVGVGVVAVGTQAGAASDDRILNKREDSSVSWYADDDDDRGGDDTRTRSPSAIPRRAASAGLTSRASP